MHLIRETVLNIFNLYNKLKLNLFKLTGIISSKISKDFASSNTNSLQIRIFLNLKNFLGIKFLEEI